MPELVIATYLIEIKKVWKEQISDPDLIVYFYDSVADPTGLVSKKTKDAINVTKAKASRIMNRQPGGNVHQIILDHIDDDIVNSTIVGYFETHIVKNIRPYSIDDLLNRLRSIITRDLNIPVDMRNYLTNLGDKDHLAEFLAKVFQYSAPRENVLKDNQKSDTTDVIAFNRNNPLPKEDIPEKPEASEKRYVDALVEVYAEMEGNPDYNLDTLMRDTNHLMHFKRQRSDYFAAEAVRRGTRDIYAEGEIDQFEILKDETYEGIIDTYEDKEGEKGIDRLRAILAQAAQLPVDQCWLSRDTVWIGNAQKKGVCHFLVNDGRLDGWVKQEDETV